MTPTNRKLDPAQILAEFFESMNAEDRELSPSARVNAIAQRHDVSRQAVLHHLQSDPRWTPNLRSDVETDAQGIWRMRPIDSPLAEQIGALGASRGKGLAQVEQATKALLPLLARARRAKPTHPDFLSLGQLEILTGISRGHIGKMADDYIAQQAARKNGRRKAR